MKKIFARALRLIVKSDSTFDTKPKKSRPLQELTERELILLESEIGAELFGPIAKNHRREFFNDEHGSWIWHEEWIDDYSKVQSLTTRYEVQPKGILKVRIGEPYTYLEGEELRNLVLAVQMYYEQVARKVYSREPKDVPKLS